MTQARDLADGKFDTDIVVQPVIWCLIMVTGADHLAAIQVALQTHNSVDDYEIGTFYIVHSLAMAQTPQFLTVFKAITQK